MAKDNKCSICGGNAIIKALLNEQNMRCFEKLSNDKYEKTLGV